MRKLKQKNVSGCLRYNSIQLRIKNDFSHALAIALPVNRANFQPVFLLWLTIHNRCPEISN